MKVQHSAQTNDIIVTVHATAESSAFEMFEISLQCAYNDMLAKYVLQAIKKYNVKKIDLLDEMSSAVMHSLTTTKKCVH